MYKNAVHGATAFLDGRRTRNLYTAGDMTAATDLRRLRESLPGSPGVRAIAAALGYEKHNAYGYYESKDFKKDTLPLDKAREFASAFERLGGDGRAVLKLAGLTDEEVEREHVTPTGPAVYHIQMAVALPSADRLAAMMSGLLKGVGLEEEAGKHAETLARRLPVALARAVADSAVPVGDTAAKPAERRLPPAEHRPGPKQ